jgi:hypothetical protein
MNVEVIELTLKMEACAGLGAAYPKVEFSVVPRSNEVDL